MKKIVLISLILTGQIALEAMQSTLSQNDTVLLVVGESKAPVEIARKYALLSRTIKNSLEDARSSHSAQEPVTCPLQEVSEEVLRFVIGQLQGLFEYQRTINTDLLNAIKDDLGHLTHVQLCEVARAIEYLDIPVLAVCCAEVVQERLNPGVVDWHSITSLPVSMLSELLRQKIEALAGITYEDQAGSQISRDEDTGHSDPAYNLARRGHVPVLSTQAICRGHEQAVRSVYMTSDTKIVSGSSDGKLHVWDMQGKELAVCRGHQGDVYSVCVTSDNKIVSGSGDRAVRVWDTDGTQRAVCRGHEGPVYSVCVTSDNKIVSSAGDKTIRLWDIKGKELAVCRGHEAVVNSVCVTSDSKIVSGSGDNTVRIWDMQGTQLAICRGHESPVYSVCVSSNNKIVSGSGDKTVRLWDIQGKELAVCRGHEHMIWSVCLTPDSKIVSGSFDKTIRLWDIKGNELAVCSGHTGVVNAVCVTSDTKIVSGSSDSTVRVWDMQGSPLAICRGHESPVYSVCVTSDNKIVSCSDDTTILVWDVYLFRLVQKVSFLYDRDHAQALWSLLSSYNKETLSKEDCLKEIMRHMSQERS